MPEVVRRRFLHTRHTTNATTPATITTDAPAIAIMTTKDIDDEDSETFVVLAEKTFGGEWTMRGNVTTGRSDTLCDCTGSVDGLVVHETLYDIRAVREALYDIRAVCERVTEPLDDRDDENDTEPLAEVLPDRDDESDTEPLAEVLPDRDDEDDTEPLTDVVPDRDEEAVLETEAVTDTDVLSKESDAASIGTEKTKPADGCVVPDGP